MHEGASAASLAGVKAGLKGGNYEPNWKPPLWELSRYVTDLSRLTAMARTC